MNDTYVGRQTELAIALFTADTGLPADSWNGLERRNQQMHRSYMEMAAAAMEHAPQYSMPPTPLKPSLAEEVDELAQHMIERAEEMAEIAQSLRQYAMGLQVILQRHRD